MTVCLLTIDPQKDFCSPPPVGKLYVPGAEKDMDRLAVMVDKYGGDIDSIEISLDSHYPMHISHPLFWIAGQSQGKDAGKEPNPFTVISVEDVKSGKWRPKNPAWKDWALQYVTTLENAKRYVLCIWPPHCIIGSENHAIYPSFFDAVTRWETKYSAMAPRITKGSNIFTEHYSIVKADCPRPDDPTTRLNYDFINILKKYDDILISGEALSHCVANTVRDVASEFSEDQIKKFVLLEDASSNVAGFEKLGDDFVKEMVAKGMRLAKTDTFFK